MQTQDVLPIGRAWMTPPPFVVHSCAREPLGKPLIILSQWCHLMHATQKTGIKYPTQLFLATCLDGNSNGVILCYAVAPVENKDNWLWFLQLVDRALFGISSPSIAVMSDCQKGLTAAVREVWPGMCWPSNRSTLTVYIFSAPYSLFY
jgi:MULE transposase domain